MIRLITLICMTLLFLSACGVKGDLRLKGKPEPQPPAELTLQQQGNEILLRWEMLCIWLMRN